MRSTLLWPFKEEIVQVYGRTGQDFNNHLHWQQQVPLSFHNFQFNASLDRHGEIVKKVRKLFPIKWHCHLGTNNSFHSDGHNL